MRRANLRQADRAFVAEGVKVVGAALDAKAPVEGLYLAAGWRDSPAVSELVARAASAGIRADELGPGVMERVADTVTPQLVCAVVAITARTLNDLPARGLVLVCVDVRDPGNLGAIVRSAAAAGVDAVVCCSGSVDPYNPKAVRASAGALFQVPVVADVAPEQAIERLAALGYRCVATVAHGGVDYAAADWSGPVAVVLGNEASGLTDKLVARADGAVTIPMAPETESLNVAMTAAVLAFEAARQRREAGPSAPAAPR